MKNLFLKPHNEIAVREIRKDLKTSNMVCTVRATGTGKSYIIAELVRDYNNCLIMAPNYFIMDQQAEVIKQRGLKKNNKVQFVGYNYAAVSDNFVIPTGLDLIVLDEFHRAGAPVWWNNGIRRIIEANPEAKVLGTTATNIRGTDKRDMAKELFNGKITMPMTLPMAWSQRVLPLPKYVAALYNVEEVLEEEKTKILESKITEEEKKHALKELNCFYVNWQKSGGIPGMLKRFFPMDTKKMIVFVDRAEEAEKMKKTVGGWFKTIGIKPIIKTIHYKKIDSNKILKQFKKKDNRLRIVIAVNKLNEGIHVPGVDCVMFLRRTHSNIVFLQQMGRCLSVDNVEKMPVIFDLVGNIELTQDVDGIFALKKELDELEEKRIASGEDNRKKLVFQIEGYILEQVRMIQLVRNLYNITERYLAMCRDIISRKAWDEARAENNQSLYDYIRYNKNRCPEAMTIWKHISLDIKSTDYYLSLCRDIISRKAWDEVDYKNNRNQYVWICRNRNKYPEAMEIFKQITLSIKCKYYLSLCRDIISRKSWNEARLRNNFKLYNWIRTNSDKYSEAAEVWEHVSPKTYYLSLCRDIISRKAWNEAKYKNNKNLYTWIEYNKDRYPEAMEIWNYIFNRKNSEYYLSFCRDIISREAWDEARKNNNSKLYDWIRINKNKCPETKEIWEHIKR